MNEARREKAIVQKKYHGLQQQVDTHRRELPKEEVEKLLQKLSTLKAEVARRNNELSDFEDDVSFAEEVYRREFLRAQNA